jgi:trehalose 6-phosphate phosphatase
MLDADATNSALFLDIDGTLIDIAPAPELVRIPPDLAQLIGDLTTALGGALAILTGRPIVDVDRFLAPLAPVAAGVHGAELRMSRGGEVQLTAEPIDPEVIDAVRGVMQAEPGVFVELKRASVAVHYRLAPDAGPRIERALQGVVGSSHDHLILCKGRKVLEIMPRHISKGTALERIAELPAFRGRVPIMIGDDVSDLTAFAAAVRLGGHGLKVAGGQYGAEESAFHDPMEVREWLMALVRRQKG